MTATTARKAEPFRRVATLRDAPVELNTSLEVLIRTWLRRDDLYALGPFVLSPSAVAAVRAWRERETDVLAVSSRAYAWTQAHTWFPPVPRG
jgi:hypothetical protein